RPRSFLRNPYTSPSSGGAASLPGKIVPASAAPSTRRCSLRTPLSTARRSVVGLRSRFSKRSLSLTPGQSAITRPPLSAPPARITTVPVPWSVPSLPIDVRGAAELGGERDHRLAPGVAHLAPDRRNRVVERR